MIELKPVGQTAGFSMPNYKGQSPWTHDVFVTGYRGILVKHMVTRMAYNWIMRVEQDLEEGGSCER